MKPLRISLRHGTWWLTFRKAESSCMAGVRGSCDDIAKTGRKWIYISDDLRGKELLDVLIHEMSHAADPRAGEEAIEDQASTIADALWRLGWRQTKEV